MRRFELRNGTLVEAIDKVTSAERYSEEYKIIISESKSYPAGRKIVLVLKPGEFPKGGAYGVGFDIIKEVF